MIPYLPLVAFFAWTMLFFYGEDAPQGAWRVLCAPIMLVSLVMAVFSVFVGSLGTQRLYHEVIDADETDL